MMGYSCANRPSAPSPGGKGQGDGRLTSLRLRHSGKDSRWLRLRHQPLIAPLKSIWNLNSRLCLLRSGSVPTEHASESSNCFTASKMQQGCDGPQLACFASKHKDSGLSRRRGQKRSYNKGMELRDVLNSNLSCGSAFKVCFSSCSKRSRLLSGRC